MKQMIEIFEGSKKVAEMDAEAEWWSLTGDQKRSFIKVMELQGRDMKHPPITGENQSLPDPPKP